MNTEIEDPKKPLPQRRIRDVKCARTYAKKLWDAGEKRRKTMAHTRNQLEGGRPKDPAELEKDGASWETNVNFGDAAAAFNRTYTPYWKMVNDVPNRIAATIHLSSPKKGVWEKAVSECFDLFLKDWGMGYLTNFMLVTQDFVKFGPGYGMYDDKDSPRFKHARCEHLLLPKGTNVSTETWSAFAVRRPMSITDLWGKIRDKKTQGRSRYAGWSPAAVRQAIALCMKKQITSSTDWTEIQDQIVSNDLQISEDCENIDVYYLYTKEFDGKISCQIFTESDKVDEYLYEKAGYAEEFAEIIGPIYYDLGTAGLVHSIKGFAIKNFYFSVLQNTMKSRMMDAATFAMAMNFVRTVDTPSERPPIENYGAVNVFANGLTQMQWYPQLAAGQAVIETLDRNQAENNAIYREQREQIADTQTARQAVILANLSEEVGAAVSSLYLAQVGENLFGQSFKRLRRKGNTDPDAVKFVKRMKARGVPEAVIYEAEISIETGANPGTAGAALRDMIFKELLGLMQVPEINRRAILQSYLANKLGAQAVGTFLLPEGSASNPAQRREAMKENLVFGQGMQLPVDPNDAHYEHSDEHLKPLDQLAAAMQNGMEPKPEHIAAMGFTLAHTEEHLKMLEQDETAKEQLKQVWPRFTSARSTLEGLVANLQKQTPQNPNAQVGQN
jgi:hypothetical protein